MKRKLVIDNSQDFFTIQTDQMLLQAKYNSPIKQCYQYIEQYEKYRLKAELSSINLKEHQYNIIYKKFRQDIENQFEQYTYKTMEIIHDLLLSTHFLRIIKFKGYNSLIKGFRIHLLNKQEADPYEFQIDQFNQQLTKVKQYLSIFQTGVEANESQKIKKEVNFYIENLKKVQKNKMKDMDNCNVKKPYLAQNKKCQTVNSGQLFIDYYENLWKRNDRTIQIQERKHFRIYESVIHYFTYLVEGTQRIQKKGYYLIKDYEYCLPKNTSYQTKMNESTYLKDTQQKIDISENHKQTDAVQQPPALVNRTLHVKFKGWVKLFDQEEQQDFLVELRDNPEKQVTNKIYEDTVDPYDRIFDRRRIKADKYININLISNTSRSTYRDVHRKVEYVDVNNKFIKIPPRAPNWYEIAEAGNIFSFFITKSEDNEIKVWNYNEQKKQTTKQNKVFSYYNEKKDTSKNKKEDRDQQILYITKQEQLRIQSNQIFENKQKQQEKKKRLKLRALIQTRNYAQFAQITKLPTDSYSNQKQIYRYGIRLYRNDIQANSLSNLDKFFFYFFKQRYFQEHEKVQDNATNPIQFNEKDPIQFCNRKVISHLLKLTQSNKFFMIWSKDIIIYEQKQKLSNKKSILFTIYSYSSQLNAQRVMYELRRRITCQMEQKIVSSYFDHEVYFQNDYLKLYSKVEVAHRSIFNRHRETKNLKQSIKKGKQLVNQILDIIANDSPFQQN